MSYSGDEDQSLPYDRLEESRPQCPFGTGGGCCRICHMGPCRVTDEKQGMDRGVCGAGPGTVVARNLYRQVAAGAASHADHAREVAEVLREVVNKDNTTYKIRDKQKLRTIAKDLGINTEGDIDTIGKAVADAALNDFEEGNEGTLNWLQRMPKEQRQYLTEKDIQPTASADMEVARAMHRTTQGNDADSRHLLQGTLEAGLADGYAGLTMGTDLQDILFGTPMPTATEANLGVLNPDQVNIAVHGHSPVLSEMVVKHAQQMEQEAKKVGADGINIVGICCTGNELAQRDDIPLAAHSTQAEMAVTTGSVDAMVVDVQCIWPGLDDLIECHHTKLITTTDFVQLPEAEHVSFNPETADADAQEIIKRGINAYQDRVERPGYTTDVPDQTQQAVVGVSDKFIFETLANANPEDPTQPLVEAIKSGQLRGIVGIVGCPNPKLRTADMTENLIDELLAGDILPIVTGCIGHIAAQEGYLDPKNTDKMAGDGLATVLDNLEEAAGAELPPVWHMGSCVDNSRIGNVLRTLSEETGTPTRQLPVVASAPELIAEKAVSIGTWALALGLPLHVAPELPVNHSDEVTKILTEELKEITGGYLIQESDPDAAANEIISAIDQRREVLFASPARGD